LDGGPGTTDEIWIFEALFKGVSTRFGPLTIETSIEKYQTYGQSGNAGEMRRRRTIIFSIDTSAVMTFSTHHVIIDSSNLCSPNQPSATHIPILGRVSISDTYSKFSTWIRG